MGLDFFWSEDIRNALLAARESSAATAKCFAEALARNQEIHPIETVAEMRGFQKGYEAALSTIALAFGLAPQAIFLRQPDKAEPYKIKSPPEWVQPYAKKGMNDEQD